MLQYILSVARSKVKPPKGTHHFLSHIVNTEVKEHFFPFFIHGLRNFARNLLYDFFNPGRVDSAIQNKPFQCNTGNFFPHRIKTGNNHRLGRIIDNNIDTGQGFQCTYIAPFTPDNPPLHFITRQAHRRNGYIACCLRRQPLNGRNQDIARFFFSGKVRFFFYSIDKNLCIPLCFIRKTLDN